MHMKARILGVSSALLQMLTNLFISCFPPFANACSKRCFTSVGILVTLMKLHKPGRKVAWSACV